MPSSLQNAPTSSRGHVDGARTFIDELLEEQRSLTAVDLFSRRHRQASHDARQRLYRDLIPLEKPGAGRQYAFEVDLDKCSGCKACVSACHSLNGLEEGETWRSVGLLIGTRVGSRILSRPVTTTADQVALEGNALSFPGIDKAMPSKGRIQDGNSCDHQAFSEPLVQHVTTACHHCIDPGCLNGCPVLAYEKDPVTGIVRHLDDQCMGCTYCVMKCPYEVPQYSERLGIVRKCDMCSHRLADGEAPACVQACPDQAIRITVVDRTEVAVTARESWKSLVSAGSPDPEITRPATRFVSRRELSGGVQAADLGAVRLDHAHWPLVIMLVCTQTATGMFLTAALTRTTVPDMATRVLILAAFGVLNVGLTASVLHLGRPLRAWRSFLGWRRSWLSREIMAFGAFAGLAALAVLAGMFPLTDFITNGRAIPTIAAALVGLIGVFTSAMVYVDTRRPFWSPGFAFGNFFGTTLLLGPALAAAVFERMPVASEAARRCALVAIIAFTALLLWRLLALRIAIRNSSDPIHFNARVIQELLPWLMRLQPVLLVTSAIVTLPVVTRTAATTDSWCAVLALAALISEIAWRYAFFAASGSRRMPGGIAA